MAKEYAKVLDYLNIKYLIIGRSNNNFKKNNFINLLDLKKGGLKKFLNEKPNLPDCAIIAVDILNLTSVSNLLIDYGIKKILLEKPGSLFKEDLSKLFKKSLKTNSNIYIAYNRRYFESIELLKSKLKNEKVKSLHFDFSEMIEKVIKKKYPKNILSRWLIANSTHIIDLVIYILGKGSLKLNTYVGGVNCLNNHKSIFIGAGRFNDIFVTYHSNWKSPGNWSIFIMTDKKKYILNPIEKLKFQLHNSQKINEFKNASLFEKKFKPGLYKMTKHFIYNVNLLRIPSLKEHINNFKIYDSISQYL